MKDMGVVQGNAPQAIPIIVGKDTVYVHTNIQPVIEDGQPVADLFSYYEIQYTVLEYIQLLANNTNTALADSDAFNVDQELRLVFLELGMEVK